MEPEITYNIGNFSVKVENKAEEYIRKMSDDDHLQKPKKINKMLSFRETIITTTPNLDKESDALNMKLVPKYKFIPNSEIDQIISPRSIIKSKNISNVKDKLVNIHEKALNRIQQYQSMYS